MNAPFQLLLVHVDNSARSAQRLAVARQLALAHGAALAALHAVTPGYIPLPPMPVAGPDDTEALRAIDGEKRRRARSGFDAAMAGSRDGRPVASWCEVTEAPVTGAFVQQALYADLLVLGQHDPSGAGDPGVPSDFVSSVLVASGKPAVVVPYAGEFAGVGERIVIAWKETREAARAVCAAIPLLRKAARVDVLSWQDDDERDGQPWLTGATLDLQRYLGQHGVEARWHPQAAAPGQLGEQLLSRACDLEADLLVMGCYGHSRAREWVLGGSTRTVLHSMTLPVLMVH